MKVLALRAVPVFGWLYIAVGVIAILTDRAPANRLLRAAFWIDVFLSVVVHAAQIPAALRASKGSDRSAVETAVMTQIFGLTWWKTQEAA
ncbi:hypothetical protein JK358_34455 [Nocardia sp. 2]|uniref:Uncharacterized protein n=1 Tax=Nocardia acididurans TaxID=2802282 RepID=A0ABS1MGX5_9NOCA|nr:hypothetical protein [Nocardia acididurans]MBL1079519.1 hypothetical protein [Nocardia acididurans]